MCHLILPNVAALVKIYEFARKSSCPRSLSPRKISGERAWLQEAALIDSIPVCTGMTDKRFAGLFCEVVKIGDDRYVASLRAEKNVCPTMQVVYGNAFSYSPTHSPLEKGDAGGCYFGTWGSSEGRLFNISFLRYVQR
jgi:hypothetical protein